MLFIAALVMLIWVPAALIVIPVGMAFGSIWTEESPARLLTPVALPKYIRFNPRKLDPLITNNPRVAL